MPPPPSPPPTHPHQGYIDKLPDGVQSMCEVFADDTFLFSKCHGFKKSKLELKEDLINIKKWAYQWKMDFNPDPKKARY